MMVAPPAVRLLAFESLAWKVKVTLEPCETVDEDTVTVDCAEEIPPGSTVTVGSVDETAVPPIVAVIVVAVPGVLPVKVAV